MTVTVCLACELGRCWLSDSRRRRACRRAGGGRPFDSVGSPWRLNRRVLGTVTMPVSWAELGGPGVAGRCHANHVLPLSLTAVTSHRDSGAGLLSRDPAVVPVLPAPAHGWRWPARGSVLPVIEVSELCPPQAVMISAYGSRIVGQVGGHVSTADLAVDTWRQKNRQPVESQCEHCEALPRSRMLVSIEISLKLVVCLRLCECRFTLLSPPIKINPVGRPTVNHSVGSPSDN